jgi:hypothetical protein
MMAADLQLAAGEFAVHEGGEGALFVVVLLQSQKMSRADRSRAGKRQGELVFIPESEEADC